MLPRPARLRDSSEFRTATRRQPEVVRVAAGSVVVHVRHPDPIVSEALTAASPATSRASGGLPASAGAVIEEPARVGFVVARSVGSAVVRNQVRRRLRHAARAVLPSLPAGSTVVVRALPVAATTPYPALSRDVADAVARGLRRLGRARPAPERR